MELLAEKATILCLVPLLAQAAVVDVVAANLLRQEQMEDQAVAALDLNQQEAEIRQIQAHRKETMVVPVVILALIILPVVAAVPLR
jgi:hypothetical protein